MKIYFIYPNSGSQVGFNYGVSHMAAVLAKAGHQVLFRQLCEDLAPLPSKEEFIAEIKKEAPDLLAFSVVTNQWSYARQLASWVRESLSIPMVCGGVHALVGSQEILETGLFDYLSHFEIIFLMGASFVFIIALGGWITFKRLALPIQELAKGVENFTAGDLDYRIPEFPSSTPCLPFWA